MMKNKYIHIILLSLFVICFSESYSQNIPQLFKYQAIVRDLNGDPMGNKDVSFQITIYEGSCSGNPVYQEQFSLLTNSYGLVNLNIGGGTLISGSFTNIDWGISQHYINVDLDVNGGSMFSPMSCTQLLSVPYALYAKESGSGPQGPQGPTGPQGLQSLIQQTILANNDPNCPYGGVKIELGIDSSLNGLLDLNEISSVSYVCNGNPSTDDQQINSIYIDTAYNSLTGNYQNYLYINLDNDSIQDSLLLDGHNFDFQFIDDFEYNPLDTSLYIQLSGDVLKSANLNYLMDNTDNQQLLLSNDTLYLEDGGKVYLGFQNGVNGATGATGPAGQAGIDGQDGATGATGPAGQDGIDGATGATGPAGQDGIDGSTGATGATGPAGQDGIDGQDGATGATGPAGKKELMDRTEQQVPQVQQAKTELMDRMEPQVLQVQQDKMVLMDRMEQQAQQVQQVKTVDGATGATGPAGQDGIDVTGPAGATGAEWSSRSRRN